MSTPKKHLLLDFGGVCLLNPVELHRRVEERLELPANSLTWMGPLDPSTDDRWRAMVSEQISERDYWNERAADVGRLAGLGDDWDLRAYLTLCYNEPEDVIIRPGAHAIVRDARAAGRRVGVLTNDLIVFHGQEWVDGIGFFKHLDALTDASQIGVMKPDPRAYAKALEDLDATVEDVVFVDDQMRNVNGARSFGLTTVYFDVANPGTGWAEARSLLGLDPQT